MGRRVKVAYEDKIDAVESYLSGSKSSYQIADELQVNKDNVLLWIYLYQKHGPESLVIKNRNTFYPTEIKSQAVQDYHSGNFSLKQICASYQITSTSILRRWIKLYNGHELFRSHNSKGDKSMTQGRKTTYEERIEIVSCCIERNENYHMVAEAYSVSYHQVYTWTKKYKEFGPESLIDLRGKRKPSLEMNETQKLAAQIKLLEAENKRMQMELGFLKKLKEVERRR